MKRAIRWLGIGWCCLLITTGALAQLSETRSPHGTLRHDCGVCHATGTWSELRSDSRFDHDSTNFPLVGRHTQVACRDCHASLVFSEAEAACLACHADVHQGEFALECSQCHSPRGWLGEAEMRRMHRQTRFPLPGIHASLDCRSCHAAGRFADLPVNCQGCHQNTYLSTRNPDHAAAGFPLDCSQCHEVASPTWRASYEHTTTFPLTGGHEVAECSRCHAGGYAGMSSECVSCHRGDYDRAVNPDHAAGEFPLACADCHSTIAWRPATFDHNLSDFPLDGAHVRVNCQQCHAGGQYTGTPSACYDCHRHDYEGVEDPNHAAAEFPFDCLICHTTEVWSPSTFDHAQTAFPLTGAHAPLECQRCHVSGQFPGTPTACYACHQSDYEDVSDPNHVANNYPHECTVCHSTARWDEVTFDHNQTDFPLTGRHVTVSCLECHANGQFEGTPTACYACHQSDYEGVSDPNHVANNYPHDCTVCHSTARWDEVTFDHNQTDFPLTGRHVTVSCLECHANGQFEGTPTACYSCHQSDYEGVSDPNHVANNYPHDCTVCHSTARWDEVTFDHNQTDFPLTGAHTTVNCLECHANGQFEGTPTACYSCHQSDYEGVSDPNHVANNYPHDCTVCHSTARWDDVTFDHNQTDFPLTGAHTTVNCLECHANGQFEGTPTDCFFCHEADYNTAQDPNHSAAGFPHDCLICHTTFNWNAQFDHDALYFPIYSGEHRREWDRCSDCHIDPNNYAIFSCIVCHEHNCEDMEDEHDDVPGFVCESQACLACHPDGSERMQLRQRPEPKPRIK